MFEGDMAEGELEIGQVSAQINGVKPIIDIFSTLLEQYYSAIQRQQNDKSFVF